MATLPKSHPHAQVPRKPQIATIKARGSVKIRVVHREFIAAAQAKTHFLQLLDQVERDRNPLTITKRGRVVAQIVPVAPQPETSAFDQMFGRTRGWMTITGDIVSPDHESWGPDWR